MEIRPMGAELFHADGRKDRRTDMTKVIVAYQSFAKTLKNWRYLRKLTGTCIAHYSVSCSGDFSARVQEFSNTGLLLHIATSYTV